MSTKRPSVIDTLELAPSQPSAAVVPLPTPAKPRLDVQHTSVYLPRAAHERLREIAFHQRCKIHDLIMEGVDHVIASRGHSETATRQKA